MKYEKCKVILVETREKNRTFKVSPSGKMLNLKTQKP